MPPPPRYCLALAGGPAVNGGRQGHQFLPSTRQSGVERFNGELNIEVNLPLKLVFEYMENVRQILDVQNPYHLGACQILGKAVLAFADAQLETAWDVHVLRRSRGPAKGRPCDRRLQRPHPTGLRAMPAGVDAVAMYGRAMHRAMRTVPSWAAARDPLHSQPQRQAQRSAAVMAQWGSVANVWSDICHNSGRTLFIPGFRLFLRYQ